MPGFNYQVLDVREDTQDKLTMIVELVELPQQNLLAHRPVYDYHVVRLDTGIPEIASEEDENNLTFRRKLAKE